MFSENINRRILIIDDSLEIWETYRQVLCPDEGNGHSATRQLAFILETKEAASSYYNDDPGFQLSFASQGKEGLDMIRQALDDNRPYAVAFIDIRMPPGWDGMETAARIREISKDLEIVIVTAYSDRSRQEIVAAVGWPEKLLFLRKPFDPEELYQLALSLTSKWNIARREEKALQALASSEERFRNLVETTSDFVWETNVEGVFTYCSPISEDVYGYRPEELTGTNKSVLFADDAGSKKFIATLLACTHELRSFYNQETTCRHQDGSKLFIESSAAPAINEHGVVIGFRGIDRDVTERKHTEIAKKHIEEQYRQSQKMEAVGTLAGGIAHDLNNMLTPIMGYAEICLLKTEKSHPMHEPLTIINASAGKAADLIRQILAFSRKQTLQPQIVELNDLIKKFSKILRRLIPENIELSFKFGDAPMHLSADMSQVEQILINLVVNARDSISNHGHITIRTALKSLHDECLNIEGGAITGDFAMLEVSDNGSGIPRELRNRIFDPFFTTKEVGKGTGMGLSTVHGIVSQHHGHIRLLSEEGKGTTFEILFPHIQVPITAQEALNATQEETVGGTETILLVEDDAMIRILIASSLKALGYSVIEAGNGTEALEKFSGKNSMVDLLLTDVVMPGMGGKILVRRCRQLRPDLAVIYMSGYPFDQSMESLVDKDAATFLGKPFAPQLLAKTIRKTLDRAQAAVIQGDL